MKRYIKSVKQFINKKQLLMAGSRVKTVVTNNYKKLLIAGVIVFTLSIIVIWHAREDDGKSDSGNNLAQALMMQEKKLKTISDEQNSAALKEIKNELQTINDHSETENQKNLGQVASQLSELIALNKQESQSTQVQIASIKKAQKHSEVLSHKIQQQISDVHSAVIPKQYLPVSVLPFSIEGISFWNSKPMVTISMADTTGSSQYKLIGEGGQYGCFSSRQTRGCTLWTVKSIDADSGVVILGNTQSQFVKVTL